MFINELMNQEHAPLLERVVEFTAARHRLLAANVANISTPGYRQKDLSVERFQAMLRSARSQPGAAMADRFAEVRNRIEHPRGLMFHDGATRSVEQLISDQAKNAMLHNVAVELLRKQYQLIHAALRERVG